jgi:DNA polymerase-3 subunit gamma/tau
MTYQVLARKWRPSKFSEVIGQEHVLKVLINGLLLDRVHHAYLFSGTRGVGKTTIARLLAKALSCETGINTMPCGCCNICLEIDRGAFIDLIEVDAASRTKVEDTRELLDNIYYSPSRGRFKVYLIDEVHMLSRHSFNALLKTLEEPPSHVKFLLATTDPHKLPATVLSRCLQLHLKPLDADKISDQLKKILCYEKIDHDTQAINAIAHAADGSMRDALSLTDQAIAISKGLVYSNTVNNMLGLLNEDHPVRMIEALVEGNSKQVMALIDELAERGTEWEKLLVEMLKLLHHMAMTQLFPNPIKIGEKTGLLPRLDKLATFLDPSDIQLYYQILMLGRKDLPMAPSQRMGIEMSLLRALAFRPQVIHASHKATPKILLPHESQGEVKLTQNEILSSKKNLRDSNTNLEYTRSKKGQGIDVPSNLESTLVHPKKKSRFEEEIS